MPVTMQQLQNLSSVTDLDQLKFGADNQLEKRVGLGAFFRKVGDAFLKLSASGRASIAVRNEKLMAAFSEAVNSAREAAGTAGAPAAAQTLAQRFNAVSTRLRIAATLSKQNSFNDFLSGLQNDARFKALPQNLQKALGDGFVHTARQCPYAEWAARLDILKNAFMTSGIRSLPPAVQPSLAQAFADAASAKELAECPARLEKMSYRFSSTDWNALPPNRMEGLAKAYTATASSCDFTEITSRTSFTRGYFFNENIDRLPEGTQKHFIDACIQTCTTKDSFIWRDRMNMLQSYFFGTQPAGYDPVKGGQDFGNSLRESFLSPEQQHFVKNDIHSSFILDTRRRAIDSFNGVPVPQITDEASKDVIAGYCVQQLDTLLGAEHQALKPFISMMASQAGLDSAQSFLPAMCGVNENSAANLQFINIYPNGNDADHHMHVTREGDTLTISTSFRQGYVSNNDPEITDSILEVKGSIDMVIDLSQPPTEHVQGGKSLFIPTFTMENVSASITRPGVA